ncbi:alpha/beta fold hydrolase [Nocardioides sp. Bht2]|uniref:alpha/beta fold hydrolase n=1 Tax=Nocardioides sp. Bht2 TaxID=3392297 RepID=UPI0039B3A90E
MPASIAASNLYRAEPTGSARGTGVLVLAGSSGRLDVGRADALAAAGATALALRWFGGEGQPPVPCEIELELFVAALDLLAADCERLAILGLSYGAEAALLTAVRDSRVSTVVALAPTDVAWEGQHQHDDDPRLSKWTWRGEGVPFVPLDREWVPALDRPAFAPLYLQSRASAGADAVEAARIPAETFRGTLVLVAGEDDQVWPGAQAARRIAASRAEAGLATHVVIDAAAGHPVVLPGETPPDLRRGYQVGGDEGAPQRLGALAWPAIREALHLT